MKTSANQRSFSSKIINPYFIPLFPSDAARPKPESNGNSNSNSNSKSTNESSDPPPNCDVVQGPSLLRTPAPRPHPTLMLLPGLRSLPFWTSDTNTNTNTNAPSRRRIAYNDPSVTRAVEYLEQHAETIREEYLRVAPSLPSDYENTQDHTTASSSSSSDAGKDTKLHQGDWDWHTYLSKGNVRGEFVSKFPETSRILQEGFRGEDNHYQLFEGTPFGFCFFSKLGPGAKIAAHNAPTNLRLRIHLPIVVNVKSNGVEAATGLPKCGIRVASSFRSYEQDQVIVLDDAYDHEVWNDTSEDRVVLLVDIWHPDVTRAEKEAVVEMFQKAKRDGLWKR
eukprot:CAMPEP_0172367326 /NCGR_PEP_ID=MMETSP1060-20121228/20731_1 /TAXON_ID=37318 /ORGANISM="Pseudo-nitzschia pungens, Strain cf. cingulata" /LENGTH=335 /DNA_ID=CAMNT_0013091537 /DNA_START=195 /DNA_END=1202 /DNA_ORIENTATION=+